jgi:hypothetical protein
MKLKVAVSLLTLGVLAVLAGFSLGIFTTADSPIIVSDGSTRYHHRKMSKQSTSNIVVADLNAQFLECPANKGFKCDPTPLIKGWALTVYDGQKALIATITSPQPSEVDADFGANNVAVNNGDLDLDNFLGQYVDATPGFQYFQLVNGGGGINLPMTQCDSTKPCRIKLTYKK